VARQGSAKPRSPVRIRPSPLEQWPVECLHAIGHLSYGQGVGVRSDEGDRTQEALVLSVADNLDGNLWSSGADSRGQRYRPFAMCRPLPNEPT
jgi:hypothetical protein